MVSTSRAVRPGRSVIRHVKELAARFVGGLAATIVTRGRLGLGSALAGDVQHSLPRHPPLPQPPSLIDGHEQNPWPESAVRKPGIEGRPAGIAQMRQALLVVLAAYLQRPAFPFGV